MRGYSVPLYELAPTNGRNADSQARYYGYDSAADLAAQLPPDANAADIGAGFSPLGRVAATVRPDVTWINVDLRYNQARILNQARGDSPPPNLGFAAGDITDAATFELPTESFDRVFSSRLIQHIELEDVELARNAIINMGRMLNAYGSLQLVGKPYRLWRDRLFGRQIVAVLTKGELQDNPGQAITNALAITRLPDIHRWRALIHNVHATAYFGQAEWRRPDSKGRSINMHGEIWDPKQREFISRASLRGHVVYSGFQRRVLADPFPRRMARREP